MNAYGMNSYTGYPQMDPTMLAYGMAFQNTQQDPQGAGFSTAAKTGITTTAAMGIGLAAMEADEVKLRFNERFSKNQPGWSQWGQGAEDGKAFKNFGTRGKNLAESGWKTAQISGQALWDIANTGKGGKALAATAIVAGTTAAILGVDRARSQHKANQQQFNQLASAHLLNFHPGQGY